MKIRDWYRVEQSKFLKEFGTLLTKGYSVTDALVLLEIHYRNDRQYPVKDMIRQLKKGIPLFEVLEGMKVPCQSSAYLIVPVFQNIVEGDSLQKGDNDIVGGGNFQN